MEKLLALYPLWNFLPRHTLQERLPSLESLCPFFLTPVAFFLFFSISALGLSKELWSLFRSWSRGKEEKFRFTRCMSLQEQARKQPLVNAVGIFRRTQYSLYTIYVYTAMYSSGILETEKRNGIVKPYIRMAATSAFENRG